MTILCYSYAVRELCLEYKRDVPTVIKLIYDAKTRQVRAQYGYERLKSLSEYDDNARCRMWFDEIRAKNLQNQITALRRRRISSGGVFVLGIITERVQLERGNWQMSSMRRRKTLHIQ